MVETAVVLADEQRTVVDRTIRDHCTVRRWTLHALNVRSNHVHVVATSDRSGAETMNQFKAWCSRRLSDAAGLVGTVAKTAWRRHWFTEGGDCKMIDSEEYLANAIRYVKERKQPAIESTQRQKVPAFAAEMTRERIISIATEMTPA